MSPFKTNIQKFLIFFFTVIPMAIIVVGVSRARRNNMQFAITPIQESPTADTPQKATSANIQPKDSTTIVGQTYQTPYGNVSASITVKNGMITAVAMPKIPDSPPSVYASKYLIEQAMLSGSANIQGVSGATYTTIAFRSSLEDAIAKSGTNGQAIAPKQIQNTQSTQKIPSVPRRYRDDDDDDEDEYDD